MLSDKEFRELSQTAQKLRKKAVEITMKAGGAHIGGGLSMIDMLTLLFFKYMNIDPKNPDNPDRDRFVLSKGHAAIGYVPVLAERGFFDVELLNDFNKFKSPFGMHPDSNKIAGCDASTGSLGHGLPLSVGMALGARIQKKDFITYCIMGDGELNEGTNWEAAMAASHHKVTNLVAFVDRNKHMIDGRTKDIMNVEPLKDKWEAFGWKVIVTDGHDLHKLSEAIEFAQSYDEKPVVIIADTIKGKGVDFMEDDTKWHYGSLDSNLMEQAFASIDKMYAELEKESA
jgi:transketolase